MGYNTTVMKQPVKKSRKPGVLLLAAAVAVLAGLVLVLALYGGQLTELFSDRQRVGQLVDSAGSFGPLVYMFWQVVQVFVAPIRGQVVGFAGGFLFGAWLGTLYSMLGALIGFTLVFVL